MITCCGSVTQLLIGKHVRYCVEQRKREREGGREEESDRDVAVIPGCACR